jgi:hypothetical protein
LSFVALALWVMSLALIGFVLYAEQEQLRGIEILATGWLSPLAVNFAWYANPLFLWSIYCLLRGRPALGPTVLAVLLSLDTLRFSRYPLDEGGGATLVYGYGWGAVLWLAALGVLASATGTHQIEKRLAAGSGKGSGEWLRPTGFGLCLLVLVAAAYLAAHDRRHANTAELERLSGLAFKRYPVCGAEDPVVAQPLMNFAGTLEVTLPEASRLSGASPFDRPTALLAWGVPVVRVAGRDYSYASAGTSKVLTSVPASSPPAATLAVTVSNIGGSSMIAATLIDETAKRTVFDQGWQMMIGGRYCPDYSTFPDENQQPRKLLAAALGVQGPPPGPATPNVRQRYPIDNTVTGVMVGRIHPLRSAERSDREPAHSIVSPLTAKNLLQPWNRKCPAAVGWDAAGSEGSPVRLDTGWPFMVGDRAFYHPQRRNDYYVLCAGEHAYLYSGSSGERRYELTIEKRRLSDFSEAWSGYVVINDQEFLSKGHVRLDLEYVEEGTDGVTMGLIEQGTDWSAVVKAPLQLTLGPR